MRRALLRELLALLLTVLAGFALLAAGVFSEARADTTVLVVAGVSCAPAAPAGAG